MAAIISQSRRIIPKQVLECFKHLGVLYISKLKIKNKKKIIKYKIKLIDTDQERFEREYKLFFGR